MITMRVCVSPFALILFFGVILAGCAGKTHLDKVATSIAQYGSMTVSAPILLDVEQSDAFDFDLDKSATYYFDEPRVEGAVRLFTQRSVDVQVATKIQLEELAKAVATLNAAQTPAAASVAKDQITKIATTIGALNQFSPGGGGAAGVMADPALKAGMSFLMDSLEKQAGTTPVEEEPEGTPPETVEEATGGEQGEFLSLLPFAKRPAQGVLTSEKFTDPLDRYSGQVSISPRQALNLAANDKMTQDLLKFLAKPKGYGNNKKAYFCVMTVACQPGFVTRTGYAADVLVSMEYGRAVTSEVLKELFDTLSALAVIADALESASKKPKELDAHVLRYEEWLDLLPKNLLNVEGLAPKQHASYEIFLSEQRAKIAKLREAPGDVGVAAEAGLSGDERKLAGLESATLQAYKQSTFEDLIDNDSLSKLERTRKATERVETNLYANFGGSVGELITSLRQVLASETGGGLVARQVWEQKNVSSHKDNVATLYESEDETIKANSRVTSKESDRNESNSASSGDGEDNENRKGETGKSKKFPYEDSFSRPLVTGVYPMVDGQVLDLRSSMREQMAMASALALSGFGIQSESLLDEVERVEQDAQTQTVFSVGSSYSANGYNFGFRVEPRFVALDDPASSRAKPGYRLESVQFPAMVLVFADKKALSSDVGGDGGEYDHIVFHTEQKWTPIVDYGRANPFSIRGSLDKTVKNKFLKPYKSEHAMLQRAFYLDELKVALGDPGSEQAEDYEDYMIDGDYGELVESTLYRRRAALAATGLGSSIFVKLPSYPGPKRDEFAVTSKDIEYQGWKNAVSWFPVHGKGFSDRNILGAVVGGRNASIRILGSGAAVIVMDMWGTDTEEPSGEVKVELITSKGVELVGTATFDGLFKTEKIPAAPRVNLERNALGNITGLSTQGRWSDATTLLDALDELLKASNISPSQGIGMRISGGKLDLSSNSKP